MTFGTNQDTDAVWVAARRAVSHVIKARARFYARRPMTLDMLHPGLSNATPDALIAITNHLIEREQRSPRRWFGFGGEVSLLNAQAAGLLGRATRRAASRMGRKENGSSAPQRRRTEDGMEL